MSPEADYAYSLCDAIRTGLHKDQDPYDYFSSEMLKKFPNLDEDDLREFYSNAMMASR